MMSMLLLYAWPSDDEDMLWCCIVFSTRCILVFFRCCTIVCMCFLQYLSSYRELLERRPTDIQVVLRCFS